MLLGLVYFVFHRNVANLIAARLDALRDWPIFFTNSLTKVFTKENCSLKLRTIPTFFNV